jgi:hypothetical protein
MFCNANDTFCCMASMRPFVSLNHRRSQQGRGNLIHCHGWICTASTVIIG